MANTFEDFMLNCFRVSEPQLRKWCHKTLPKYGFDLKEDTYQTSSSRLAKDPELKIVHNLLAIRGNKPKICLVAHTDVCRDHDHTIDYSNNKAPRKEKTLRVNPVIKTAEIEEEGVKILTRVIQDKTCDVQVGGDDRLGVAINLWIALNTGYDMGLYFPTDEEKGLLSARACKFKELKDFELCAQVDRGNNSHELVNKIHDTLLCDYDTTARLLEIAFDIGMPRKLVSGNGTDVCALKESGMIKNGVNMTCGYHHSYGSSGNEYVVIDEAKETLRYVSEIVKDFALS